MSEVRRIRGNMQQHSHWYCKCKMKAHSHSGIALSLHIKAISVSLMYTIYTASAFTVIYKRNGLHCLRISKMLNFYTSQYKWLSNKKCDSKSQNKRSGNRPTSSCYFGQKTREIAWKIENAHKLYQKAGITKPYSLYKNSKDVCFIIFVGFLDWKQNWITKVLKVQKWPPNNTKNAT